MVMVVLDRVLLVSASSREREGKRYSKSIFILRCSGNVCGVIFISRHESHN